MKKIQIILSLSLGLILLSVSSSFAAKPRIAWFYSDVMSGFWPVVQQFVLAASEDLGVDIQTYSYKNNPMTVVSSVENVLSNPNTRPDAILIHNYKNNGKELLELSERYKIPAFIFNAGFSPKDNVGKPREKYKYWIGLMLPDDEYAGYILAKKLMKEAKKMKKRGKDGKIHVVALEGNRTSEASNSRVRGFKRAMRDPDFINKQYFHSKWRGPLASEAFELSIIRYPEVSLFWTASDSMAIGVIKAAEKKGWVPGKDFVTGGIDLLPSSQKYLKSGEMAVSVGGHYAEGAWAIILLYDYLKGYDFASFESTIFFTKMGDHTSSTFAELGDLREKLSKGNMKKIDFKRFSRAYNPSLKKYNFEFKALFR